MPSEQLESPPPPVEPPHPEPPRPGFPWRWAIPAAVVALLLAGAVGGGVGAWLTSRTSAAAVPAAGTAGTCAAVPVADAVLPSVVTISVQGPAGGSSGSGEIIRDDYVLTNDHVISSGARGGRIEVLFSSGDSAPATIVGRDPRSDLAVLSVSSKGRFPVITLGRSDAVVVGQPVIALGAPLGLAGSVTAGIVSALGRDVQVPADGGKTADLGGAIQTDASINPGNSGGALVDCSGHLIGINTAIATVPNASGEAGGGSVGIGFAIPVDLAISVADRLISQGTAVYPTFGMSVTPISPQTAAAFGTPSGLFVTGVDPRGPAAAAGLRVRDIVTVVDGQQATSVDDLWSVTFRKAVGDQVAVTYLRGGVTMTTTVTLAAPS